MTPARLLAVAVLVVGVVAALAVFLLVAHDERAAAALDFEPNRQPSALADWTPSWPADTAAAGEPGPSAEAPEANDAAEAPEAPEANDAAVAAGSADSCGSLPEKWLMVGWDGADWELILPMLEAGELPHLERLMRGGSYGTLHSIVPTLSPAIWTTVATGRTPGEHGILHFYNQKPRLERWKERLLHFGKLQRELYSNADRRSRAVWNLLGERGHPLLMVGYHNTFPVEEIDGLMVSNYLVQDSIAESMELETADEGLATSLVYPPEHLGEVLDIQKQVNRRIPEIVDRFADLDPAERDDFLRRSRRLDPEGDQRPYFLVHAWAFDAMVAEVAEAFMPRIDATLALVHFQSLDWAAHRFLYYHDRARYEQMDWSAEVRAELDAEMDRYAGTVRAFYRWMDERLGRLDALRGPETGLLLLSDHGFAAEADPQITGGHDHAPPGMIVLHGPGIRADHRLGQADVYDILPTLMAGLQLPVAQDLRGKPLRDAFCDGAWQASQQTEVASYGEGRPFVPQIPRPEGLDQELLRQLESLGYLN